MVGLSIPTDNYYKFCAIFGLLLTVGPLVGFVYFVNYTEELISTASLASAKVDIELSSLDSNEVRHLQELRKKIMEAQFEGVLRPEDIPSFFALENLDKRIGAYSEKMKAAKITLAEAKEAEKRALRYIRDMRQLMVGVTALALIGGLVAVFGFKKWYEKTQGAQ